MNRKTAISLLAGAALTLVATAARAQESTPESSVPSGNYASVNGLEIYYEVHGTGEPLVLLHGGLGGIWEFAPLIPVLAQTRQVIAVELQGHGHTADIDRSLSFPALADDVAALIRHLGYAKADVLGYSFGGIVALATAGRHPEVVDKLVVVSSPFARAGIHAEFQAGMAAMIGADAQAMLETPMYQYYSSVAPNLDDWSALVTKVATVLGEDFDLSADVAAITAPALIVAGDNDFISPAHIVEMYSLLGGGVAGGFAPQPSAQLAVLPNTIHFTIISHADLPALVTSFLDAPPAAAS
jgi:pimeloyl-ACP methyl ester carboxylesterase